MEIEKENLGKKKLLFLIHEHADPDAVGSAYYLSRYYGGEIATPSPPSTTGKNLLSFLDFELKSSIDADKYDLIIVLDTPDMSQLEPFEIPLEKVLVIDHHSSNSWDDVDLYLEERTSCAEIVYEIIGDRTLTEKEGIALAGGIFTDSSSLQRADAKTLLTLGKILERSGIDIHDVKEVLFESRSFSEKIARLKGAKRADWKEVNGFILAETTIGAFEGSVASYLLDGGADIALVINPSADEYRSRIIGRAVQEVTDSGLDLGKLFTDLAEDEKGFEGGGHPGAAVLNISGPVDDISRYISEKIIKRMKDIGLGRNKD